MKKFRVIMRSPDGDCSGFVLRAPERLGARDVFKALRRDDCSALFDIKIFTQDNDPGWRHVIRRPSGRRSSAISLAEYWLCQEWYHAPASRPGYRKASRGRLAFREAFPCKGDWEVDYVAEL